jgi:hypothetical protein
MMMMMMMKTQGTSCIAERIVTSYVELYPT